MSISLIQSQPLLRSVMGIHITIRPPCLYHFGLCWFLPYVAVCGIGWLYLHHSEHISVSLHYINTESRPISSPSFSPKGLRSRECGISGGTLSIPSFSMEAHSLRKSESRRLHGGRREHIHIHTGLSHCPCSSNQAHGSTFAVFRVQASDSERLCERLAVSETRTGWG